MLFCVGGTSMAVGLLLSAFAKSYSKEELYLQQKFKERLADLHATVGKISFCMAVSEITPNLQVILQKYFWKSE